MVQKIDVYPGLHFGVESDKCILTSDGISLIKETLTSNKEVKAQILKIAEDSKHDPVDIIMDYLVIASQGLNNVLENPLDKEFIIGRIEQGIDSKYKDISVGLRFPSPDEIKNCTIVEEDLGLDDASPLQQQEDHDRQRSITQNYFHFKPIEHFMVDSKSHEVILTEKEEDYILGQIIVHLVSKRILPKEAAYPSREIERIITKLTDEISKFLESNTTYKNFILEAIAIKPEYRKYIPTINYLSGENNAIDK